MFGICDGHGLHGHSVSNFIKDNLSSKIMQQTPINLIQSKNIAKTEQLYSKVPCILHNSFNQVNNDLRK